ncbi:Vi polysaccharide biosynthesis UDP-N-acetylglucosamine C-6 dehydrogenase TviB [Catalinimonas niigatensis]|uniref:Vi polysaccharide biosynthesis UDP-N-acetylglucosamine C-6 dehydrogenase TviB n=1 Tax=Catalinimonas niigatensis TaxID=1397264 RepID=UPI002666BFD6|nr:Vi polysaccharide biosynthesis UDP-N-acetylglucosamine C-6 dehydrogenase TviB [Catalinimonas niigatensis]WPP53302.1 Vi polysaccharide biosynthesis UDP-N-acetylglucosamine C-6 dehydrogenase TviB [Catalinimonas niigatensis]
MTSITNQRLAIIGLGYVGLPLAVEFGKEYQVVGFDVNHKRIQELREGKDNTDEVESEDFNQATGLTFTDHVADIKDCNIFIVTVPTPIDQFKKPDLTPLRKASETIGKVLKKNDIVIYESTVYPGCTEEDCVPLLEQYSGLVYNKDFYCGYSPERINPGDKEHRVHSIKKVTSGSTPEVAEKVDQLYQSIITAGTYKASSIRVAEAAKVIENAQRDINIAFVNELALIFDRMQIDTQEVLEAAGTKWNFLPFKPGLVGGHCIGVDPYYLTHKAESIGYHPQVILAGRRINDNMGSFVAHKVVKLLSQKGYAIKGAKVLMLGITFKENCPDIRNSRVIDIIHELQDFGVDVDVYDPLADSDEVYQEYGIELLAELSQAYDGIVMAVGHKPFLQLDLKKAKKEDGIIYDVKSILDKSLVDGKL